MSRQAIRKELEKKVLQANLAELTRLVGEYRPSDLVNPLFIFLCSAKSVLRWKAISLFALVIDKIAAENMEDARIIMRRFLWSLNDESGGIGWGAPETMAETMVHNKHIRTEYLHMLISYMREDGEELFEDGNYLELPMLQEGLLWGVARLCQAHPEEMQARGVEHDLFPYLSSSNETVVLHAVRALRFLGVVGARLSPFLREMDLDKSHEIYNEGDFIEITVASIL